MVFDIYIYCDNGIQDTLHPTILQTGIRSSETAVFASHSQIRIHFGLLYLRHVTLADIASNPQALSY